MGAGITVELETTGNNHSDSSWDQVGPPFRTPFTSGSVAGGETYNAGDIVTWAVQVTATNVNGLANFVFNIELRHDTAVGALVDFPASDSQGTIAGFFSSMNDGDDISQGVQPNQDENERAAFALGYETWYDSGGSNGPDFSTGRVIDLITDEGPNLDYFTYPSASGHPAGSTAITGTLIGIGAGYSQFSASGCPGTIFCDETGSPTGNTGGVGTGLGLGPIVEGQLNTTGLATGTYVLVVTAAVAGQNLLDDGFDPLSASPGSFAVASDTGDQSDDITFQVTGVVVANPTLVSAASRKDHGVAAFWDIDLPLALEGAGTGVEMRQETGGEPGADLIVLEFSEDVTLDCSNITTTDGSCSSVSSEGSSKYLVTLTGLTGNTCNKITVGGVTGFAGDDDVWVLNKTGDANGDANGVGGDINLLDLGTVKQDVFQDIDSVAKAKADVNADGDINLLDLGTVKQHVFEDGNCVDNPPI
jgi:hypothetical protein